MGSNSFSITCKCSKCAANLRPPPTSIENLVWFSSSNYQQRSKYLLKPFKKTLWTCSRRSELSFLFLAFAYIIASGSWLNLTKMRLQIEFDLVWWLYRWYSSPHTTDKNCSTLCRTYRGRRPEYWPWLYLLIYSLKHGEMSGQLCPDPISYIS